MHLMSLYLTLTTVLVFAQPPPPFDTGCPNGWVSGDGNTMAEELAGLASTPQDCIDLVREQCPAATIANFPNQEGNQQECWCQYGPFIVDTFSTRWYSCFIGNGTGTCDHEAAPRLNNGDLCGDVHICGYCDENQELLCQSDNSCARWQESTVMFPNESRALDWMTESYLLHECSEELYADHVACVAAVANENDDLTITLRGSALDLPDAVDEINALGLDLYPHGHIYSGYETYEVVQRGSTTCSDSQIITTQRCTLDSECSELECRTLCDSITNCKYFFHSLREGPGSVCHIYSCCTFQGSSLLRGRIYRNKDIHRGQDCPPEDAPGSNDNDEASPSTSKAGLVVGFVFIGLLAAGIIMFFVYQRRKQTFYSFEAENANRTMQNESSQFSGTIVDIPTAPHGRRDGSDLR